MTTQSLLPRTIDFSVTTELSRSTTLGNRKLTETDPTTYMDTDIYTTTNFPLSTTTEYSWTASVSYNNNVNLCKVHYIISIISLYIFCLILLLGRKKSFTHSLVLSKLLKLTYFILNS